MAEIQIKVDRVYALDKEGNRLLVFDKDIEITLQNVKVSLIKEKQEKEENAAIADNEDSIETSRCYRETNPRYNFD